MKTKLIKMLAAVAAVVGLALPSIADGVVAKIGDAEYTSLGEALAAVANDPENKVLTWVDDTAWPTTDQAYYGGASYATLSLAIKTACAVSTDDPARIFIRPNHEGLSVTHDLLKRSVKIFGNNAKVNTSWAPSIELPGGAESEASGYHTLTRNVSHAIYSLHNGAGFWGTRCSDYDVTLLMVNCQNANECYARWSSGSGQTVMTVRNCTFLNSDGNGNVVAGGYAAGWPVALYGGGSISVDNCTFEGSVAAVVGSMDATDASLALSLANCTFKNLKGQDGCKGGIRIAAEKTGNIELTVDNCQFIEGNANPKDITIGDGKASKSKATVSYSIKNTACSARVTDKDASTVSDLNIAKSATPVTGANVPVVAKIGTKTYSTLAAAITAATAGQTVEIVKEGDYTIPDFSKAITVKAVVDGVNVPLDGLVCYGNYCGGTLDGFNFVMTSDNLYNGFNFDATAPVTFRNCKFNKLFATYGTQIFDHCEFTQSAYQYSICTWGVYTDQDHIDFIGCTFNGLGKYFNVYTENASLLTINITDCKFINNNSVAKKAALLIKELADGSVNHSFKVVFSGDNQLEGLFPQGLYEAEVTAAGGDGLWAVEAGATPTGKVTVFENDEQVYPELHHAVKIGKKGYASLSNAVEAAVNGDTLVLQEANAEKFLIGVKTLFTIDPSEYEFAASNLTAQKGCELVQNLDNTWSHRMKVEVVDQVSKTVVRTAFEEKSESAAVAIADSNFKQIFKTTGSKELEFIAPGVGTVTFNSSAVDKIGANMKKAIQAIGGEEDSANTKTTLTLALADVSDEVKPAKPTVIIAGGKPQEVVQTFSVAAVMQTLVQQGAGTTSTNEEVFAQGKTGDLDEATVTIPYSGIKPQVWFVDTAVSPWTTNDVWTSYDAGTKKLSFKVTHFSDYPITDAEVFAKVGDEKFGTLQEAFDFVKTNDTKGTTVVMTKDNAAGATLAADVTATLDMNGKKMTQPIVNNGGTLTITGNGEIDVGTVQFAQGAGKTYIKDGTYTGVFPDATGLATNAGPILVSGGKFKVSAPVPVAFCAVGYLPVEEPVEGFYTVKDANVYIRNINAVQRYPWNGYVDITAEVCWGAAGTAKLYVTAVDKQNGDKDLGMTWVDLYVDGVKAADQVNCATGFTVEAATQEKLRLVWNSTEGVPSGSKKDRVGFKFLAK